MKKLLNTYGLINEFKECVQKAARDYGFSGYIEPTFSIDINSNASLGYIGAKVPDDLKSQLDALVALYEYAIRNYEEEKIEESSFCYPVDDDPDWEEDNEEGWVNVWNNPINTERDDYEDFWNALSTPEEYYDNFEAALDDMLKDDVNHPDHYNRGGMEVIDVLRAFLTPEEFRGFVKGNSIKYLLRAGYKDDEVKDLSKCKWYIDEIIRSVKK